MTDQLRTLAEARSQIAFPVPELHMLKEIRKERRIGYVEGFIEGRTSGDAVAFIDKTLDNIDAFPESPWQGYEVRETLNVIRVMLMGGEVAGDETLA